MNKVILTKAYIICGSTTYFGVPVENSDKYLFLVPISLLQSIPEYEEVDLENVGRNFDYIYLDELMKNRTKDVKARVLARSIKFNKPSTPPVVKHVIEEKEEEPVFEYIENIDKQEVINLEGE